MSTIQLLIYPFNLYHLPLWFLHLITLDWERTLQTAGRAREEKYYLLRIALRSHWQVLILFVHLESFIWFETNSLGIFSNHSLRSEREREWTGREDRVRYLPYLASCGLIIYSGSSLTTFPTGSVSFSPSPQHSKITFPSLNYSESKPSKSMFIKMEQLMIQCDDCSIITNHQAS